jgi:hypothetical protein
MHGVNKDFEVCGVNLNWQGKIFFYILAIYRSPSGNFIIPKIDLIICGDMNINYMYLEESSRAKELNSPFKTFNLVNISFPTRMHGYSSTSIDNIFTGNTRYSNYSVSSLHTGLSDHEGQLLIIDLPASQRREQQNYTYRKINKFTAADFPNQLSYGNWDEIFGSNNLNLIFNSFLNTCGNFSFITQGIRVSCNNNKKIYIRMKNEGNP